VNGGPHGTRHLEGEMTTRLIGIVAVTGLIISVVACGSATTGAPATAVPSVTASPTHTVATTPSPSLGTTVGAGEAWIAFQDQLMVHLVRPDGSGDHVPFPLIPGGEQLHPDWSPEGERLSLTLRGETDVIWIGNSDGTETKLVVECQAPCLWADEAAWSPDGTSLVFQRMVSKDGNGVSTLEILDVPSGETRVVLTAPEARVFYQPRWSRDGTQIVTELAQMSSPALESTFLGVALAVVDVTADAPVATEITEAADFTNSPDWSWVTDRIVFAQPNTAAGFDGSSDLVTMRPDGTDRTSVLSVGARGGQTPQPAWSTDGSRIIFVQPDSSMSTIAADGSNVAPAVSDGPSRGLHPRYRPVP
jgi:dipeptidyl aminopeptidase/acylaminoacyl peptidase